MAMLIPEVVQFAAGNTDFYEEIVMYVVCRRCDMHGVCTATDASWTPSGRSEG